MQNTWVQSLGQEDPLKKEMASHISILAWRIPWTDVGYSPWGHKELDMTEQLERAPAILSMPVCVSCFRLFVTPWTI